MTRNLLCIFLSAVIFSVDSNATSTKLKAGSTDGRPRVIVTSDGEIDDECSMVRFLLYANEWDVEAIITSSSQYRAHGHNWAGDNWAQPYLEAYAQVHPNLLKHDPVYPTLLMEKKKVLTKTDRHGHLLARSRSSRSHKNYYTVGS